MKEWYVIHERETLPSDESLSYEEKNALRYTAGYNVPRALKKKIDRSSHPLKKELLLCLLNLSEESGIEGESCE